MQRTHRVVFFALPVLLAGVLTYITLQNSFVHEVNPSAQLAQASASSNLVGWWKFDEGVGSTTADSSATGHAGTFSTGATWATGIVGAGAVRVVPNGKITLGDLNAVKNHDFSVSLWVNVAQKTYRGQIIGNAYCGSSNSLGFCMSADNNYILFTFGDGTNYRLISYGPYATSTWYHLVGTFSWADQNLRLYVNGIQSTNNIAGGALSNITNSTPLSIGGNVNEMVDDVQVYDRVVTSNEAALLYHQGMGGTVLQDSSSGSVTWLTQVHVASNGSDTNRGTIDSPVASIQEAVRILDLQPGSGEIVIHAGTYPVSTNITIAPPNASMVYEPNRTLTIRAADGEKVVFDGSTPVSPTPLSGYPGIYLISGSFSTAHMPQVWEVSTRTRYTSVTDMSQLQYTDHGVFVYSPTALAIRPQNGVLPPSGDLRLAVAQSGLLITRNNVTVRGLNFYGFGKTSESAGIQVGYGGYTGPLTSGIVLDKITVENTPIGLYILSGTASFEISSCVIRDVAMGIEVRGYGSGYIHHCSITNDDSPSNSFQFMMPSGQLAGFGLHIYSYTRSGTYSYNFIKGFLNGLHVKVPEPGGPFVIEHNTIIDDPYVREGILGKQSYGIGFVRFSDYGRDNSITRYNIIDGYSVPFGIYEGTVVQSNAIVEKNVFWNTRSTTNDTNIQQRLEGYGMGTNTVSDPYFVDRATQDYRVLSTSPAVGLAPDGAPAGAFSSVSAASYAAALQVNIPWIYAKQYSSASYPNAYDIATTSLKVVLTPSSAVTQTKVVVTNEASGQIAYSNTHPFIATDYIPMAGLSGLHTLAFSVMNAQGLWSSPITIRINVIPTTASYADMPYVRANRNGFVVFLKNTQNSSQYISYRVKGSTTWTKGFDTADYSGTYTAPFNDIRQIGSHPMMVTGLQPDTVYEYQVTPKSGASPSPIYTVTTTGDARTYYVGMNGVDSFTGGSQTAPFKSLQFALDLSLPGDNIRILPGLYYGASVMFHSGVPGAPIIIEADKPGTVILDAQSTANVVLMVSESAHLVVRNLTFQAGSSYNIVCYQCAYTEFTGLTIQNAAIGSNSVFGTGISIGSSHDVNFHHNMVRYLWSGIQVNSSPNTNVHHNTVTATALSAITVGDFSKNLGSTFTYNSLNFTGNHALELTFEDGHSGDLTFDYNNYGTSFQTQTRPKVDANMIFTLPYSMFYSFQGREFIYTYYLNNTSRPSYYSFAQWKTDSGEDNHSIFADPQWVDPANDRFDVKSTSANILSDGQYIGFKGYLSSSPSPTILPSATPTPTASPSPTPSPTPVPTPTPTVTPTSVPTTSPSSTPLPTATPTPTVTPSSSPSAVTITSYVVSSKTNASATIRWTTNIPTIGTINYGLTSTGMTSSVSDGLNSSAHTATLTGLTKGTKYYYRITATNPQSGSTTASPISTFKTMPK